MSDDKPMTGLKKRQQIADTRKQVFLMVALSSAIVVICVMIGIRLFKEIVYQSKVNDELGKTVDIMNGNVRNISPLIKNAMALSTSKNLSLPNLKEDDTSVFQVIIDALPTIEDSVDLGSSLQDKVLAHSGVRIEQINVERATSSSITSGAPSRSTGLGSATPSYPSAKLITFKVTVSGDYESIQKVLKDIENTIRPITITKISLEGNDIKLTAGIEARTYYSDFVQYRLGSKEVPREEK